MPRIEADKDNLRVVFHCKTKSEMEWVLQLYSEGAQEVAKQAKARIGISDEPKLYLVQVDAAVYNNDLDLVVVADDETEAINIVKEEKPSTTFGARGISATLLTPGKTKVSNWTEYRPSGKGIIHEYSPHAGDPNLGA